MAYDVEFWVPDGPNGEVLEFAIRCVAWEILPKVDRYRRDTHCYIMLRRNNEEAWTIWINPKYQGKGTMPTLGKDIVG